MINTDRSVKADAVLAVINDLITNLNPESPQINAVAYVNGREHGWKVFTNELLVAVLFAENRNSDDIVVYTEKSMKKYADTLSSDAYENSKMFGANDYLPAAVFILKQLEVEVEI